MSIDPPRTLYEGRSTPAGNRRAGGYGRIVVTEAWCDVDGVRYPITELRLVGTARGHRPAPTVGRLALLLGLAAALVLVAVATGSGWTREVWPAVAVAVVGTLVITFAPATVGALLRRPYEIWASYRGADVRLFVTQDAEQHGQVARALIRARELSRP